MMRCERDWGRVFGVRVRCVRDDAHDFTVCVVQTPTQAVAEAVRAVLGDDKAQIVVCWANDRIVGLHYNSHPLGEREWNACADVGLPLVGWSGPPRTAWLISVGKAFRCSECHIVVS